MLCTCMLSHFSCVQLCDPVDYIQPTRRLYPRNFLGKNTGVGCHSLFQGIFLTQESNPCLTSPALAGGFFTTRCHLGRLTCDINGCRLWVVWVIWWHIYIWRGKWQPTLVLLPGESLGQRSLVGYRPWGLRVGHDWETDTHTHIYIYI